MVEVARTQGTEHNNTRVQVYRTEKEKVSVCCRDVDDVEDDVDVENAGGRA